MISLWYRKWYQTCIKVRNSIFVTDQLTFKQRLMVSEAIVCGHCEDAFIYIRSPEPSTDIKVASKEKPDLILK